MACGPVCCGTGDTSQHSITEPWTRKNPSNPTLEEDEDDYDKNVKVMCTKKFLLCRDNMKH